MKWTQELSHFHMGLLQSQTHSHEGDKSKAEKCVADAATKHSADLNEDFPPQ